MELHPWQEVDRAATRWCLLHVCGVDDDFGVGGLLKGMKGGEYMRHAASIRYRLERNNWIQ